VHLLHDISGDISASIFNHYSNISHAAPGVLGARRSRRAPSRSAYLAPILAPLSSIIGDNILYVYDSWLLSAIYRYVFIYLFGA
jgi:hypothetical protein